MSYADYFANRRKKIARFIIVVTAPRAHGHKIATVSQEEEFARIVAKSTRRKEAAAPGVSKERGKASQKNLALVSSEQLIISPVPSANDGHSVHLDSKTWRRKFVCSRIGPEARQQ